MTNTKVKLKIRSSRRNGPSAPVTQATPDKAPPQNTVPPITADLQSNEVPVPPKRKRGRPRKHPLPPPVPVVKDVKEVPEALQENVNVVPNDSSKTQVTTAGESISEDKGKLPVCSSSATEMAFVNTGPQPDFSSLSEAAQQQQQQQPILDSDAFCLNSINAGSSDSDLDGPASPGSDSGAEEGVVLGQIMQQVLPETPFDWTQPVDWNAHCIVVTDSDDKEKKVYSCPQCHKVITKLENFQDHVRIHTGQKPYPCGVCGTFFRRRKTLKVMLKPCITFL